MANFFTADLHLDHEKIINPEWCPLRSRFRTIQEMNECIVDNWNAMIGDQDTCYIIGDFAFKNHLYWLNALRGTKVLIVGSHDKMNAQCKSSFKGCHTRLQTYFDLPSGKKKKIIMDHYPLESWEGKCHKTWHVHGHLHGRLSESVNDWFRCDVGVDVWQFAPVPMKVLAKKMSIRGKRQIGPLIPGCDIVNDAENTQIRLRFQGGSRVA